MSLLLAYSKLTHKTLTLGDFTVLQIYMQELMQPLSQLGRFWKQLRMSWVDIEMVLEILKEDSSISEPEYP